MSDTYKDNIKLLLEKSRKTTEKIEKFIKRMDTNN